MKIFVERGLGDHNLEKENHFGQENLQLSDSYGSLKNALSLLDEMTNSGLLYFADIVTDGSIEYEKTRCKMKKIIREYLPTFLSGCENNFQMRKEKIICLLKDPTYFRGNHSGLCSPTEAFREAAIKILNRLEELPPQALAAMHRKLKGKRGYVPKLDHTRSLRKRDLIGPVRNCCMKMLFKLGEREEPREPLVKALAVAGLGLKLILGHPVMEFQKFSPEIEALQHNIAKAIGLINSEKKVDVMKLEALCEKSHKFPDLNFKFSKRSLRSAIRNLLIEYLLECSDMDVIPDYLLEALMEINRCHTSSWSSSKEEIKEEVECLLCLSAQTKQIVWDFHPELEIDLDFSDSYMEDLEESDDDEEEEMELSQNFKFPSSDFSELTESMGENNPINPVSPVRKVGTLSSLLSPNSMLNIKLETMHISERDSVQSLDFTHYSVSLESKMFSSTQCFNRNEHQFGSSGRSIWPDLHALGSPANENKSEFSSTPSGLGSKGVHKVERQETLDDSAENVKLPHSSPQSERRGVLHPSLCTNKNQYLLIQKACDLTSMAMYDIIGSMLNEFAQAQHLDLRHGDISYLRSHGPSKGT